MRGSDPGGMAIMDRVPATGMYDVLGVSRYNTSNARVTCIDDGRKLFVRVIRTTSLLRWQLNHGC